MAGPFSPRFYVVEFTDNIERYGEHLVRPAHFFGGTTVQAPASSTSGRSPIRHMFDPDGLPTWLPDDEDLPESVRGLWFRTGQTFGIEFELASIDGDVPSPRSARWRSAARGLLDFLTEITARTAREPISGYAGVESGADKDHSVWNVEYDGSVGWEVTSPVLQGREGFLEVDRVCAALGGAAEEHGLLINADTGTHIHLGWEARPLDELKRVLRLVRLAEPSLATLVAPSRLVSFDGSDYDLDEPNDYVGPLSEAVREADLLSWQDIGQVESHFEEDAERYVSLNLRPLFRQGTVEVRLHSGTIEAGKILLWVSLWQQILWAGEQSCRVPPTDERRLITPHGDIVSFAKRWLPDARQPNQAALLERLHERRLEIVEGWERHPTLEPWTAWAQGWEDPASP